MPWVAFILLLAALIPAAVAALPPVASFTYSPERPRPGEAVVFKDTSTDPDEPFDAIAFCSWDFGDGTPVQNQVQIIHHTFAQAGDYSVTLTVKDTTGLLVQTRRLVSVRSPGPPIANFSFTMSGGHVFFQDLSTDPDDNIVTWIWEFGDGERHVESSLLGQAITRLAQHRYPAPGSYTATLTVEDASGGKSQKSSVVAAQSAQAGAAPGPPTLPGGATPAQPPGQPTSSPLFGQILKNPESERHIDVTIDAVFKFAIALFVIVVVVALIMRYRG